MKWLTREVFENEDHVELLQPELNTLEGSNFDIRERDDEERRIREVDQTVRCRLELHVRSERNTFECQLRERNVDFQSLVALPTKRSIHYALFVTVSNTHCFGNLFCKVLELFVQRLSSLPLLLFKLDFVFVSIAVLALPIASFVELDIGGLAVDLHVFGLLLSDHNGRFEMEVDNDEHFIIARLEEEVLDIVEQEIWMAR